ncbi:hypothetical protein ACFY3J_13885 [Streptomyces sp. NPDC001231]|uniref:hypothetical protein n=1 Tax=Streptomyces sp. NPDC001231 TaxID=3364549 RepID=UPI00369FCB1D
MTEPTGLTVTAIRQSCDTVPAAYAEEVPKTGELDARSSMTALSPADDVLGGILAQYSTPLWSSRPGWCRSPPGG